MALVEFREVESDLVGRKAGASQWRPRKNRRSASFITTLELAGAPRTRAADAEEKNTAGEWERQQRAWHWGTETGRARQVGLYDS